MALPDDERARPADAVTATVDAGRNELMLDRLLDYLAQPSVSATGEGFPARPIGRA